MIALPSAPESLIGATAALREHERTRVLVLTSNNHATEILADLLDELGYEVHTAFTGQATRVPLVPEAIIMDACLPEGTSEEVLRNLRKRSGWETIPAIALGQANPLLSRPRDTSGFTVVLPKPISIWALHRALQDAIHTQLKRPVRS